MTFSFTSDVEFLKKLPAYVPILKTVLKSQIKHLVNQLSEYGGEESVFLTASMTDGTLSHIGSKSGHVFLESHKEFKSKFLQFCLDRETLQVNNTRELKWQASRKVNKKQSACSKRKHSGSVYNSIAKKMKLPVLTDSDTVNCVNIMPEKNPDISTDTVPSAYSKTSDTSEEKCAELSVESTLQFCCPVLGNSNSDASVEDNKETNQMALEQDNKHCVEQTNLNVSADLCGGSSEDDSHSVDETDNVETDNIDMINKSEKSEGIMKEEGIIVKIEPNWDSESEEETTNLDDTINKEDKTSTENNRDDSSSTLEKLPHLSASSDSSTARLEPEFLCCNDELIWAKNSQPKQKRVMKSSSLWTKYRAIIQVEEGQKSKSVIAQELGIPKSTLSTWLKHSEKIKADFKEKRINPHQKKRRFSNHYEIEEALLQWLKIVHLQGVVPKITAVNICDKANQLAKQFGYSPETFQCTKAWVERFKNRHGFKKNFVKGESCSGEND